MADNGYYSGFTPSASLGPYDPTRQQDYNLGAQGQQMGLAQQMLQGLLAEVEKRKQEAALQSPFARYLTQALVGAPMPPNVAQPQGQLGQGALNDMGSLIPGLEGAANSIGLPTGRTPMVPGAMGPHPVALEAGQAVREALAGSPLFASAFQPSPAQAGSGGSGNFQEPVQPQPQQRQLASAPEVPTPQNLEQLALLEKFAKPIVDRRNTQEAYTRSLDTAGVTQAGSNQRAQLTAATAAMNALNKRIIESMADDAKVRAIMAKPQKSPDDLKYVKAHVDDLRMTWAIAAKEVSDAENAKADAAPAGSPVALDYEHKRQIAAIAKARLDSAVQDFAGRLQDKVGGTIPGANDKGMVPLADTNNRWGKGAGHVFFVPADKADEARKQLE